MNGNESYISIEDASGVSYLCPLTAARDTVQALRAIDEDICVEADVAGRYAGQIIVDGH